MIFTSILLLMFVNGASFTRFKMLRGTATNYTEEDLLREEDLEYPRGNRNILDALRKKWDKYYACLRERENEVKKPEIRRLLEGQYTELLCDICPRPFQDYEELEWKYKPLTPDVDVKQLDHLDLTPEMTYTSTKSLQIFNADESVAGHYVCFHKASVVSVYILEVSKNDTMERIESTQSYTNFSVQKEQRHFMINYQWQQWTECNACGRVGRKFKYGTCFVSALHHGHVSKEQHSEESKAPKSSLPKEKTPAPKEKSPAPKEKTPAPKEKSPAPKEKTPAPKEKSPAPKEKTPPKEKSPPPKEKTPPPKEKTPPPKEKIPAPKEKTPPPKEKTPPPKEKTPPPKEKIPAPKEKIPAPKEKSSAPKEKSSEPKEKSSETKAKSSAPKEKSSAPNEKSSAPKEKSSEPKEKISTPKEKSSAPNEKSSAPKEKSSSPNEKSSAPKEKSSAPKGKSSTLNENSFEPKDQQRSTSKEQYDTTSLTGRTRRIKKWIYPESWPDADLISSKKFMQKNIFKKLKEKIHDSNSTSGASNYQQWELDILDKFSTGIPCASPYLPKPAFENLRKVKSVGVLVKYCYVRCPGNEIFEVFDEAGKLIEWANNTAGIYSMFQKIPQLPPDIERWTIEADFGSDIIIRCPGNSLSNIPITWKVNNKIIFPDLVKNQSNGRFTIDLINRINLKKLRRKDSNIYSCWQRDKLVGTVHLNVEKKFKIAFDHHVTLLGIAAVVGTFVFVGSKILTREIQMRKK